ncbi:putative DNAJ domain [Rosellinia necatrix]|uniref:Putative DNAJ domain n=1 Tax=Rosellinia necatrix TaxID=77044 RepID=A0A1S7UHB5_ROSNE|nr:putative DNAJ domain [Rosellinia necatrix]
MDYHKVLGVSKDADVAGIEKAFKLLALKHHPDKANAANAPKDRTETDEERKAREKRNNDRYVKLVEARDNLVELLNNPEGEGEQSGRQWPPGDYANYRHDGHHGGESSFRGHARHAPPTAGSTRLAGSAREAVETLEKAERALNALDGELMELRETVRRARSQRRDGSTSTSTSTSSSSSSSLQYDYEAVMRLFDDALRRSDGWKGKTHCAIQHLKHTPRPSGGGGDGGDGLLPLERDALRAARAHRMLLGDLVGDLGAALARPRPDHYRDLLGKIRRAFDRFRP